MPRAKQTCNALEFRLRKSLSNSWFADVAYVPSRLYGLHSVASSNEHKRLTPNGNRDFDLWLLNCASWGTSSRVAPEGLAGRQAPAHAGPGLGLDSMRRRLGPSRPIRVSSWIAD